MLSPLTRCVAGDLLAGSLPGKTVGRGVPINSDSRDAKRAEILQAIRTVGYRSLRPPGTNRTMQQVVDEATEEPAYTAYELNDQGFVAEPSHEDNFNESVPESIESVSEAEAAPSPGPVLTIMQLPIPSPVLRQGSFAESQLSGNNTWNTTFTEDESYNEPEYVQQGFMPLSDPPAIITPRRISSRPY